MSLLKIGSAEVNATLVKAASALRDLSAENERLRAVIAENDRRDYAEKIASSAVHRGIMDPEEAKDYANSLTESDKDLSIVEEFVNRAAAGVPLGNSLQKVASVEGAQDGEADILTSFLLTNEI
ncbi:MAG: hypothetical protein VXZ72_01035 [Chlamydiota bacterium]|nr:hypothetical protein [Chlamydiota bacterium]